MRTFENLGELQAAVGEVLGTSDWVTIDQARIDQFAEATGDHQWIHVDSEKAAAGPFGTTIAHGYLTLSLLPMLTWGIYEVKGLAGALNYGLDKVRFPSPVPVGSKVRATAELTSYDEVPGGGQATVTCTIEIDGAPKPACVAATIVRFFG
ncbi:MAG: MaoC family dehydratase [Solirubrobacteraceae bacterium]|nr:MaoC family dehydratase [Solirubrobacteraceae bacterium]